MSAQPNLHIVPEIDHSIRRRRQIRALLPSILAEQRAEADRRHRTLVQLEALFAETPIWCVRERWAIRRAITRHLPSMWSWS